MSLGVVAFGAAAVAHLAFQWVVHVVVYPGLADAARTAPAAAAALHARYTGRMAVAVAGVYGALLVGAAAAVAAPPDGPGRVLVWLAPLSVLVVLGVTGVAAVPLHRSLSEIGIAAGAAAGPAHVAALHRRLLVVDRVRLVLAAGQVGLAAWALWIQV